MSFIHRALSHFGRYSVKTIRNCLIRATKIKEIKTMAIINIYLHSDGTTEEAFNFYKSIFGGEFTTFLRYNDIPTSPVFLRFRKMKKRK